MNSDLIWVNAYLRLLTTQVTQHGSLRTVLYHDSRNMTLIVEPNKKTNCR